jgi:prolyl 4-hydroxylase
VSEAGDAILLLERISRREEKRMPLTRRSLLWIGALLAHPTAAQEHVAGASYTAFDDASWAVWNVKLSTMLGDKQSLYDHHIEQCKEAAGDSADRNCYVDEYHRMQMNMFQPRSVYNYTAQGFAKIRAPEKLYAVLRAFWEANREKGEIEWDNGKISPFHNHWDAPPTMIKVQEQIYPGGGSDLAAFVSDQSREILEQWTGQALAGSSVYGVRVYHNDSILTPHVDRLPLIISAIINVDQDVDEPWPLEVYDHDGVAHNITMEPGEMILYESHSVIHGRPFPMRGRYFANVFVHFETIGNATGDVLPKSGGLPPYLVKGRLEVPCATARDEGWRCCSHIFFRIFLGTRVLAGFPRRMDDTERN